MFALTLRNYINTTYAAVIHSGSSIWRIETILKEECLQGFRREIVVP